MAIVGLMGQRMNRRDFLIDSGALLAGAVLLPNSEAEGRQHAAASSTSRMILSMNRNWKFGRFVEGGHARQFDDSSFERVVVPHTNLRLPWHSFDEASFQFISLYRRHFRLPPEAKGRRVFIDFEGAMTASTVWLNGVLLGEYKGGYTPFSFELTPLIDYDGDNVIAAQLDSTERADIPPFGDEIDYLTFGGIYREVFLRIVPETFIANIFARPSDVQTGHPKLAVGVFLTQGSSKNQSFRLQVELTDEEHLLGSTVQAISVTGGKGSTSTHTVALNQLGPIALWDLKSPKMYQVHVRLLSGDQEIDTDSRRVGFREASFTDHGFELNGTIVKLRGLDRHQTFPFAGQAMPGRIQRKDAEILKKQLKCNIVRTSHYPQSRHFLNACDDYGLLVLEEIPGWQHIGDAAWKAIAVDNVQRMIQRDWNHPSIVLWGVRINESLDNHDFYTQTNALAHRLDPTRQTGGIRYFQKSEFLEDVFTMNDFGWPLKPPNHPRYLNTEFVGHTYPVKTTDDDERHRQHTIRHARVHDQLASDPQYAGGIGWCAFDYNTHSNFGAGDHICYHGVTDIFREPKPAAGFYKSQCDPEEEVVLEPAFHWAPSDEALGFSVAMICSNCEQLKLYTKNKEDWKLVGEIGPDRAQFQHLKYPPFSIDLSKVDYEWGDLRLDGYIAGKQVISKTYSGKGIDQQFTLQADDAELYADGADTTRVVLRVTDEFGSIRPLANDAIKLEIEGPAEIIGDNPFSLVGGTGAIWIRAKEQAGKVRLTAVHPRLGMQQVELEMAVAGVEFV